MIIGNIKKSDLPQIQAANKYDASAYSALNQY